MAYNLEEQEDIAFLKAQWNSWGKWVFIIILLIGFLYSCFIAYGEYQDYRNTKATILLDDIKDNINHDKKEAKNIFVILQQKYPKTIAASRAASLFAKEEFNSGNFDLAKQYYEWIIKNQKNKDFKALSITRYATVLLEQKKYQEAIDYLNNNKVEKEYNHLVWDLQADAYYALGNVNKAKELYNKCYLEVKEDNLKSYYKVKSSLTN